MATKAGSGIPGRRIAGAALAALSLVSVAACGSDNDAAQAKEPAPATSSAAAPTPSKSADPTAASKATVLAVYGHYWVEQVKAYAKADTKGTDLRKYATKDALGRSIADTLSMKRGGNVMRGAPTSDAKVTSIDLDKKTAVIRDCLDVSRWETVEKKSGKVLPFEEGALTRYETIATAEKWGAQWLITKVEPRETGC
ncbi:hypothetical protein [Streptomyces sp. NBC_01789]|uniref:hypothetical protein n=1 Tax=Streptomyces sp. NBC_01789 TaxID=2975941 RepID=UPI00225A8419|nr:hypothetical protein [Streptomyces sp. NBC_01789]MCX4451693.1 hypothetical protein [Streptomyces sp. NBC_01789]